jgi:hypothetical protein
MVVDVPVGRLALKTATGMSPAELLAMARTCAIVATNALISACIALMCLYAFTGSGNLTNALIL